MSIPADSLGAGQEHGRSLSVQVISAVYRNRLVERAMDSVAEQESVRVQQIVVDGSRLRSFSEGLTTSLRRGVLHLVADDNGIYDALNKGLRYSSADIVGLLHSDDIYADSKVLSDVVACFEETGADVVYGDLHYVSKIGKTVRRWKPGQVTATKVRLGWMPPHPTVFLRRSVLLKAGLYDTRYRIAGDYEYLLRLMLRKDLRIQYLPRLITRMELGGASNGSLKRLIRKSMEDVWAMRAHGINPYVALPVKIFSKLPQFVL